MLEKQLSFVNLYLNLPIKYLWKNKNGYWYFNYGGTIVSLHREICKLKENPHNLSDVNHKDGNKDNNSLDNLEWSSRKNNIQHAYDTGLKVGALKGRFGALHPNSHRVEGTNITTGEKIVFESLNEANRNGFNQGSISNCVTGKRKTHKNYTWKLI